MSSSVRYCLECGWRLRDDECENPSTRMIDHAIETGHSLQTDYSPEHTRVLGLNPEYPRTTRR